MTLRAVPLILMMISTLPTPQVFAQNNISVQEITIESAYLHRKVQLTIVLPPHFSDQKEYPQILFNDGQDFERLDIFNTIENLYSAHDIPPFVCVGIHASDKRLYEYGTAHQPDYKGRGNLAKAYTQFVLEELLPYLDTHIGVSAKRSIAGFSLGGLSAIDLAWNHPNVFSRVGVFSGSLWWRAKAYEEGYSEDNDRIMHQQVRNSAYKQGLKFWFEAGTNDETSDRNNNGIIDAIDDTLDLMKELEAKGYKKPEDIIYLEVPGGEHNPETWGKVMPMFLKWALQHP